MEAVISSSSSSSVKENNNSLSLNATIWVPISKERVF